MWYVNFKKTRCKSCYACARVCPVNAIKFKNEQAQILKDRCIVCNECSKACPQKNSILKSEVSKIKFFLKNKNKVAVSIAPSFVSIFGENSHKIPTALKKLGFTYVEETVIATNPVLEQYNHYADLDDGENYFTSFCPTINNLIEKHFPQFTKNLIPVVSPFLCHTRLMKSKYHTDTKVVFIGPCLAKKDEGSTDVSVDAVITFAELQKWFKKENINLDELEEGEFDVICKDRLLFPIVGQTTRVINDKNPVKKVITVEGVKDCIDILHALEEGRFTNTIFEMSACIHSCLNGSGLDNHKTTYQEREINVRNYRQKCKIKYKDFDDKYPYEDYLDKTPLGKIFTPKKVELKVPNDDELYSILKSMGKTTLKDELNCGGCGYKTCRDHAIAIYNNISEINMCSPYMRQKAENIANLIFESSPFLIGLVDKEMNILEFNSNAKQFFDIKDDDYIGYPMFMYVDDAAFYDCLNNYKNIYNNIVPIEDMNKTLSQDIFWLHDEEIFMWMAYDITEKIENKKHADQVKQDTMELAQTVINKQMTVVQEIGRLLGETTAETKVILSRVKNLINEDNSSDNLRNL